MTAYLGVNFCGTADVYGDGHSERLLAWLKLGRGGNFETFYIAMKAGRRLPLHVAEGDTRRGCPA